ncbi:hypothetical protein CPC08DRAFT_798410 [Agrocybe pediades]|nr:hypothetical protein CPC08DRAFT_798410 [Agrocybe pediades]
MNADSTQQTQNGAPVANSPPHPQQSVGMIVGGIAGGIVFLLFLLLLVFCVRRRRRLASHLSKDSEHGITVHSPTTITPFLIGDHRLRQSGIEDAPPSDSNHGQSAITARALEPPMDSSEYAASSHQEKVQIYVNEKDGHLIRESYTTASESSNFKGADGVDISDANADNFTSVAHTDQILENTLDTQRYAIGPPSFCGYASSIPSDTHNQHNPPRPLELQDINDTPPSYESSRNHDSYPVIHVETPSPLARSIFVGSG